ncbi:MAG: TetR/AcrR family transcriptional regulator [Prevotella sp.]|nr:TetR/AcrR family transcriptional regulator [Prevotella sp.]
MTELNNYRQELRPRILETAMKLFRENGVKKVKMDDIAAKLGISKRTLYELYTNKEQLLLEGITEENETQLKHIQAFALSGKNEMEIVAEFMRSKLNDVESTNPEFFIDMRRYTRVTDYLHSQHELHQEKSIEFIRNGIRHGYFLPFINYDILISLSDIVVNTVLENRGSRQYHINEILRNFTIVLMRGFCTERGIGIIDRYFSEQG